MIIDTIGCSYDSFEELMEGSHRIEDKIKNYIEDKGIATRFESSITVSEDDRYYLLFKLIKD